MNEPTNEVVDTQSAPYTEDNEGFVPDVTDAMGTLDTSGTAGGEHENINSVTPVFEAAKAQDLQTATLALDPEHPEVPESLVNVSTGTTVVNGDPEADRQRVEDAAAAYEKDPVEVEDPSLNAAEDAADNAKDKDAATVATEVESQQAATPGAAGTNKVQSDDAAAKAADAKGTSTKKK